MAMVGGALRGALSGEDQKHWDELLRQHPELREEFEELRCAASDVLLNEVWERGLRVLMRCPQPEDRPFLESVRKTDPQSWLSFLRGAYLLHTLGQASRAPSAAESSAALTKTEENALITAVRAERDRRARRGTQPTAS